MSALLFADNAVLLCDEWKLQQLVKETGIVSERKHLKVIVTKSKGLVPERGANTDCGMRPNREKLMTATSGPRSYDVTQASMTSYCIPLSSWCLLLPSIVSKSIMY